MAHLVSSDLAAHLLAYWPLLALWGALALFALVRVWRSRCSGIGLKIFWSVISIAAPVIGPLCAIAFVRILPPHGESVPPRVFPSGSRGGWTGGWK